MNYQRIIKILNIKQNIFETNSSLIHCTVIGTASDFEKWEDGEVYYYDSWKDGKRFIAKEEAIDKLKNSKYRNSDTDKAIKYLETYELDASDYDDDEDEAKRAIFEEMASKWLLASEAKNMELEHTTSCGNMICAGSLTTYCLKIN